MATYIDSLGSSLPKRIVSSEEIETALSPLYSRLNLPQGRLEFMTGIKERRLGEPGLKPSDISIAAANDALSRSAIDRTKIDCLVHSAVCRDFLEPATASVVHHKLGLSPHCSLFDLSNACLGWIQAIQVVSSMIKAGQIETAMVVSGEDGRALIESSIEELNNNLDLTRRSIKSCLGSLTIGSGGVAAIITKEKLQENALKITAVSEEVATKHHELCLGGVGMGENTTSSVLMNTDSEKMLHAGIALAKSNWEKLKPNLTWPVESLDRIITHQVSRRHTDFLFDELKLDDSKNFPTFQYLGNIGSASVGLSLHESIKAKPLVQDEKIILLGIGSGLVSVMMGLENS